MTNDSNTNALSAPEQGHNANTNYKEYLSVSNLWIMF